MQAATEKHKPNPRRRVVRFHGLNADARTLGVHRVTLYRMLRGEQPWASLKTLRARYDALKAEQAEAAK